MANHNEYVAEREEMVNRITHRLIASIEAELRDYRCRFTPRGAQGTTDRMQGGPLPCEVTEGVSQ